MKRKRMITAVALAATVIILTLSLTGCWRAAAGGAAGGFLGGVVGQTVAGEYNLERDYRNHLYRMLESRIRRVQIQYNLRPGEPIPAEAYAAPPTGASPCGLVREGGQFRWKCRR